MDKITVYRAAIEVLRNTIQNEDVDNSYVSGIIDMTYKIIDQIDIEKGYK